MKHNRKIKVINFIAIAVIFAIATWFISHNFDDFRSISLNAPLWLLPAIFFSTATIYTIGVLTELAIEPHGVKLGKSEVLGLSALNRFGNYVSPGYLGALIRSVYLKRNYDISIAKFSSSFIVSSALQFLISGLTVLCTFFLVFYGDQSIALGSIGLIVGFIILLMLLLATPTQSLSKFLKQVNGSRFVKRVCVVIDSLGDVKSHPRLIQRMSLWVALTIALSSLATHTLYLSLGIEVSLMQSLLIAALGNWSIIFSITPASIGIKEGLMVFAAKLVGIATPATLIVALMLRLIGFVTVLIFAAYYAPKLIGKSVFTINDSSASGS